MSGKQGMKHYPVGKKLEAVRLYFYLSNSRLFLFFVHFWECTSLTMPFMAGVQSRFHLVPELASRPQPTSHPHLL